MRQYDSARRAKQGQRQRFAEQLALNPSPARSDGAAYGELVLAGRAAGEQQDRHIGASNQEQKSHRSEEQEKRSAEALHVSLVNTFHPNAKCLREVSGCLLRELLQQRLELGVGRGQSNSGL